MSVKGIATGIVAALAVGGGTATGAYFVLHKDGGKSVEDTRTEEVEELKSPSTISKEDLNSTPPEKIATENLIEDDSRGDSLDSKDVREQERGADDVARTTEEKTDLGQDKVTTEGLETKEKVVDGEQKKAEGAHTPEEKVIGVSDKQEGPQGGASHTDTVEGAAKDPKLAQEDKSSGKPGETGEALPKEPVDTAAPSGATGPKATEDSPGTSSTTGEALPKAGQSGDQQEKPKADIQGQPQQGQDVEHQSATGPKGPETPVATGTKDTSQRADGTVTPPSSGGVKESAPGTGSESKDQKKEGEDCSS